MKSILEFVKELRYFREMAMKKKQAEDRLVFHSFSFNQHLMKLIVFGWDTDWAKTIYDIVYELNDIKLKHNNKGLTENQIEQFLFKSHYETVKSFVDKIPNFIKNYEKEYTVPVIKQTTNDLTKKYSELRKYLTKVIADAKLPDRHSIYSKIKSIV